MPCHIFSVPFKENINFAYNMKLDKQVMIFMYIKGPLYRLKYLSVALSRYNFMQKYFKEGRS